MLTPAEENTRQVKNLKGKERKAAKQYAHGVLGKDLARSWASGWPHAGAGLCTAPGKA